MFNAKTYGESASIHLERGERKTTETCAYPESSLRNVINAYGIVIQRGFNQRTASPYRGYKPQFDLKQHYVTIVP
ncbi:hypothetical protein EYF80_034730 [Liparis tanakae]|uniref:Uncharacterized protein n=1 Tax=Liparis tanakae TaxID=230148 RepID=A0A4Z2GQM8_9TELE|nr:hypothetical protein EYF80_034730 [Liparis tanakae]